MASARALSLLLLALLAALQAVRHAAGHPLAPHAAHPYGTHLGPRSRAFWELAAARGQEPRVLGPNDWKEQLEVGDEHEVGFCPYQVLHEYAEEREGGRVHRHQVTRLVCANKHATTGCLQLREDPGWLGITGDGLIEAGCLYVDVHKHSVMSDY